jgi:hypothetical protein
MTAASEPGRLRIDPEGLLRQSHGFLVDALGDEPAGVVDEVVVDDDGVPVALVVLQGWFGRQRRTISVDDVAEILPRDRRLRLRRTAASLVADLDCS